MSSWKTRLRHRRCSFPGCHSRRRRARRKCNYHLRRDREYQAWRRAESLRSGFCVDCHAAEHKKWCRKVLGRPPSNSQQGS